MSILRSLLLSSAVLFALNVRGGEQPPLLTVAEAQSLTFDDHRTGRVFRLSGRAYGLDGAHKFILGDATGRTLLCDIRQTPPPGTRIEVNVRAGFNTVRRKYLRAEDYRETGRFRLPPPVSARIEEIASGALDYHTVTLRGTVTEVTHDDIDRGCLFLTLTDAGNSTLVTVEPGQVTNELVGAEIQICGVCLPHIGGWRKFQGRGIRADRAPDGLRLLRPAPEDPFAVPPLGDLQQLDEQTLVRCGRRTVCGRVIATWHGDRALVDLGKESGVLLLAVFAPDTALPERDAVIELVGRPETDLFQLVFSHALWRPSAGTIEPSVDTFRPTDVTARNLISESAGERRIVAEWHGRLVRLEGFVHSTPANPREGKVLLDCGDDHVPVDISAAPDAFAAICPGSRVSVVGTCLLQADLWRPDMRFPRVGGIALLVRAPDDVRVLTRPPWWTPARFLAVLGIFAFALAAILVWNASLRRLAERRGRALFRAQMDKAASELRIDERTRLAGELHDYLAQNLTAIAYQVSSAVRAQTDMCGRGTAERSETAEGRRTTDASTPRTAAASAAATSHLETAGRMLASCRTELRRCLWDLKSDALNEKDFSKAIRMSVEPVLGSARLLVRFNISRSRVNDTTAHAILSVIRELSANAVRHGDANEIRIAGETLSGQIRFSVRDDGRGFDASSCPGPEAGHFGLEGIRERLRRLNGSLVFESAGGGGTRAVVTIPLRTPNDVHAT